VFIGLPTSIVDVAKFLVEVSMVRVPAKAKSGDDPKKEPQLPAVPPPAGIWISHDEFCWRHAGAACRARVPEAHLRVSIGDQTMDVVTENWTICREIGLRPNAASRVILS
jgi:hypothetical protein